ncbi:MAG TPA: MBG domain-containing protein [Verrucomicrobiae bacterium]|jgi:hypothetical protein|nr:MBG domain-containing protein [Verrucomicrobiae bacterium]
MNTVQKPSHSFSPARTILAAAIAALMFSQAPAVLASALIADLAGNQLVGPLPTGESYIYAPNNAPTDIALSNSSAHQSAGANASVGTLTTTDADSGDSHTYSLVSGAGSTDNNSFNISGASLRANDAATLSPGDYSVRIQTDDGNDGTFQKAFTINIVDDIAPIITSASNANATNGMAFSYTITASGGAMTFDAAGLPNGLNTDTNSGIISGTPSQAGMFNVQIMAADAAGNVTTNALNLSVVKATAMILLGNLNPAYDGSGKSITVSTTPEGLTVALTYNGVSASPTNAGNYQVIGIIDDSSYAGSQTNTFVIAKAPLSVQADDATRAYGQTNPIFTGTITGAVPADNMSATYDSEATPTSMSGTYPIVPSINDPDGKLANYEVALTNGTLTVTSMPAVLTIESLPALVQPTNRCAGIIMDHALITLTGEVGRPYDIMVSTNFTDWSVLTNGVTDTNGTLDYMDWEVPNQSQRYFRARSQ